MASREIRDLSKTTQVLYNKFHDLCRRDIQLLKHGIHVLLVCTYRSEEEQAKLYGLGLTTTKACGCAHSTVNSKGLPESTAFDVALLRHGKIVPCEGPLWDSVVEHAKTVGLTKGCEGFHGT